MVEKDASPEGQRKWVGHRGRPLEGSKQESEFRWMVPKISVASQERGALGRDFRQNRAHHSLTGSLLFLLSLPQLHLGASFEWTFVRLFVTPRTVAHQSPISMRFSRQEHWSGLLSPSPGDLPNPGIELTSFTSPALAGRFFTTSTTLGWRKRKECWDFYLCNWPTAQPFTKMMTE